MNDKQLRWVYLDICRIVAIFFVVLIHVVAMQIFSDPVGSFDWTTLSVYFAFSRVCVPLFFMISGALALNPDNEISIKDLYQKYILRFVTCLLFWTAMFYIINVYAQDPNFTLATFDLNIFLTRVLKGHPQHWFLFMIIGMYMLIPLLKLVTKNRNACRYYLILWLFFEIFFFNMHLLNILFPNLNATQSLWLETLLTVTNSIAPRMVMGLSGYMVLGYYLHTQPLNSKNRHIIQLFGLLGLVATLVLTYAVSIREGSLQEIFYNTSTFGVFAMTLAVFVTAQSLSTSTVIAKNHLLLNISTCSFGIYLVHDFFLNLMARNGITPALFTRTLSPLILSLVVFCLSFCLVYLIKKIPGVSKYIT